MRRQHPCSVNLENSPLPPSLPLACWPLRSCSISPSCRFPWLVLRRQPEQRTCRRFGIGPRHAIVEFHDRGSFLEGFVLKVLIRCTLLQKAGDTWGQAAGTMSPPPAVTSSVAALTWSLIRLSQARATDEDALVRRPGAALVDRVAGDAPALVQLLAASDVAGGKYRRSGSHQCTVSRIVEGLLKRSSCDVAPWPPRQRAVAMAVRRRARRRRPWTRASSGLSSAARSAPLRRPAGAPRSCPASGH